MVSTYCPTLELNISAWHGGKCLKTKSSAVTGLVWAFQDKTGAENIMQLMRIMNDASGDWKHRCGWSWGRGRRTHWGWSPHHSLGNKPAVYGQLLICWVIIPFYPQLNQQQNNTLHMSRTVAGPHHSIAYSAERERDRGEVKYARGDFHLKGKIKSRKKIVKGSIIKDENDENKKQKKDFFY